MAKPIIGYDEYGEPIYGSEAPGQTRYEIGDVIKVYPDGAQLIVTGYTRPDEYGTPETQYIPAPRGGGAGAQVPGSVQIFNSPLGQDKTQAQIDNIESQIQDRVARQRVADEREQRMLQQQIDALMKSREVLQEQIRQFDLNYGLNKDQQAFNQGDVLYRRQREAEQNPGSFLDKIRALTGEYQPPAQTAGAQAPAQAPAEQQPAAPVAQVQMPNDATTPMYLPGYEQLNPNVAQQLQEWQAERIKNGQNPNDTAAFRQHLLEIGAPDIGIMAKDGNAAAPTQGAPKPVATAAPAQSNVISGAQAGAVTGVPNAVRTPNMPSTVPSQRPQPLTAQQILSAPDLSAGIKRIYPGQTGQGVDQRFIQAPSQQALGNLAPIERQQLNAGLLANGQDVESVYDRSRKLGRTTAAPTSRYR